MNTTTYYEIDGNALSFENDFSAFRQKSNNVGGRMKEIFLSHCDKGGAFALPAENHVMQVPVFKHLGPLRDAPLDHGPHLTRYRQIHRAC